MYLTNYLHFVRILLYSLIFCHDNIIILIIDGESALIVALMIMMVLQRMSGLELGSTLILMPLMLEIVTDRTSSKCHAHSKQHPI